MKLVDTSVPIPSQLQILYRGKNLNKDVTALTLYLWNDGKLPIKADDVLQPLEVQLDPDTEILDARILGVSRPVTKFTKGEILESKKNSLPLSFAILEKGDGAALQIIYTGKPDAAVSVLGTIIGAGEPRAINPEVEDAGFPEMRKDLDYVMVVIWPVLAAVAGFQLFLRRKLFHSDPKELRGFLAIVAVSIIITIYYSTDLFWIRAARTSPIPTVLTQH